MRKIPNQWVIDLKKCDLFIQQHLRAEQYFLDGGSNKGGQHCHNVKFLFLTEGCLPI